MFGNHDVADRQIVRVMMNESIRNVVSESLVMT